jgi:hypothetical protein
VVSRLNKTETSATALLGSVIQQSRESPCVLVFDRRDKKVKAWTSVNLNNNKNDLMLLNPVRVTSPGFIFSGYWIIHPDSYCRFLAQAVFRVQAVGYLPDHWSAV